MALGVSRGRGSTGRERLLIVVPPWVTVGMLSRKSVGKGSVGLLAASRSSITLWERDIEGVEVGGELIHRARR